MKVTKEKIYLLRKNMQQFGWFIPLSNLLILYGARFLPKSVVRKIVNKKHREIEDYLTNRLHSTIEAQVKKEFPMEYVENAPIWYCWLQGEEALPLLPKFCLESLRKQANGHPIHFITLENYKDYVSIPENIVQLHKEGKLKNAHFADILRLSLLHAHGGLWADATIYFSDPIPEAVFDSPFYTIKTLEESMYVSRCRWSGFFLAGWKNNPIFGAMLELYDFYLKEDFHFVDYLMMDYFIDILYQRNENIKNMIDTVPYNNTDIYSLKNLLPKDYDEISWNKIARNTSVFKLDWRMYNNAELEENRNSFFVQLSEANK